MGTIKWREGEGFFDHFHTYDHTLLVVEGRVRVRTGGRTFVLEAGEKVTHFKGTRLTASALCDSEVYTNHDEGNPT